MADVFFLSYNEPNMIENLQLLRQHCSPIHVNGVSGIYEAHSVCASLSTTERFFVVDADSVLIEDEDGKYFDFSVPEFVNDKNVYVWNTRNVINDLEYGYGGIKLFSKNHFITPPKTYVDMTSTVAKIKETKKCVSETRFNSSAFDSWKAGFREACKLTKHHLSMPYTPDKEKWRNLAKTKVEVWKTIGKNRQFGNFCMHGAQMGEKYALEHDTIKAVNNYYWLKCYFEYCTKRDNIKEE
jgi:hypothetical protein